MFYSRALYDLSAILFCLIGLFPNYLLAQTPEAQIDKAIKKMSLDQKVGQVFMVGFPQTEVDAKLKNFILKTKPGAFLLFKRNIKSLDQVAHLNKSLSALTLRASGVRPLIAVDQEGGVVSRVPVQPPLPNALALGLTESESLAETYGEEVGLLLRRLGFNMNLAPVLDLSDPSQPSFIGVRSLGGNPETVGRLGHSISKGFLASKIIPTAKHFPGLGSSVHDPHNTLVTRITSLEDFYSTDIKPFEKFSGLGPSTAIMLSHLSYPVLDPSNVPAVFSEKIIKNLLREKLGFNGIVVTDDLMMQGASQFAKPEDAALLALKSGADLIMVTWSFKAQERAMRRVKQAVVSGELPMKELDKKLRRLLLAKASINTSGKLSDRRLAQVSLPQHRLRGVEQRILESNIKSQENKFSEFRDSRKLCVLSTQKNFLMSFKSGYAAAAEYILLAPGPTPSGVEQLAARKNCDKLVVSVYGKKTMALVDRLSLDLKPNILLVNLSAPMITVDENTYGGVLNLYFPHINAGKKIAQQISKKKTNYQARTTSR